MSRAYPYAATAEGRLLIALRAGPAGADALADRLGEFVFNHGKSAAFRAGLVERIKSDGIFVYRLTPTGRAKCPERRSLMGWVAPECRAIASPEELMEMTS